MEIYNNQYSKSIDEIVWHYFKCDTAGKIYIETGREVIKLKLKRNFNRGIKYG